MKEKTAKIIVALCMVCIAIGTMIYSIGKVERTSVYSDDKEATYSWPLATCSTEDTITHIFATTFAEEVEKLSDGKMKITVYPQSTLGGDRELLESCKDKDIPFVAQSPATQVTFMPKLCVFDSPCVFDSIDEARATIDNEAFQSKIDEVYINAGYRLLGLADQCFRVMTSEKEFTGIESFKGQKIRTMENNFHIQFWRALGANPTPMSFSEVYIGLQQGTIDAQENALEIIDSAKLYEQQNYLINTKHVPDYISLIVSDEFYNELPDWQQEIIDEAAAIAQKEARKNADERYQNRLTMLTDKGLTYVEIDDETWQQMQEKCEPVYEAIREQAGDELFELYTNKSNQ